MDIYKINWVAEGVLLLKILRIETQRLFFGATIIFVDDEVPFIQSVVIGNGLQYPTLLYNNRKGVVGLSFFHPVALGWDEKENSLF